MARKKPVRKSKLAPKIDSPVQPGTIEIARPGGLFGTMIAVIRSNAEAAKGLKASGALSRMLGEIAADMPKPQKDAPMITPDRLVKSLERNRLLQKRLIAKMEDAAEKAWPGFGQMLNLMIERESEFVRALGEIGIGVA